MPNSLEVIDEDAFEKCTALTSIIIPGSVEFIRAGAFSECTNLKSVILSNGIKRIDRGVFWECDKLTSVTIPQSVEKFEFDALHRCNNLHTLIIKNPDCEITPYFQYDLFMWQSVSRKNKDTSQGIIHPTIIGYKNSTAQRFAKKYNYRFKAIEDEADS